MLTRDGKSICFRNYGSSEVDRVLLTGLLSEFSRSLKENSQNSIKNKATVDFKYVYTRFGELIIVICADLSDKNAIINSKITKIRAKFIDKYGEMFSNGSWTNNHSLLLKFEYELDNICLGAIKIALIGFGGVSKTELTRLICGKDVDLEYVPTITADIVEYEWDELGRSLTLWDFAGQVQLSSLWENLLTGTDIALLVLDSTFENINATKNIIHDILDKCDKEILVIGIANYQDMPNRLSPEFCERILSNERRVIKVYGMVLDDLVYREVILAILRDAIKTISNGYRPSVFFI